MRIFRTLILTIALLLVVGCATSRVGPAATTPIGDIIEDPILEATIALSYERVGVRG